MRFTSNDSVVQSRCKSTTLAVIAKYFSMKGHLTPSISYLVRLALEQLEQVILVKMPDLKIDNTSHARKVMAELGLSNLNPSGRNSYSLFAKQQAEELTEGDYEDEGAFSTISKEEMLRIAQAEMDKLKTQSNDSK